MRVLHLIDARSPQATGTTLAMLADAMNRVEGVGQVALLLGGAGLERSAREVGLEGDDVHVLGVPRQHVMLAWPKVRRTLTDRGLGPGDFDVVHCWSVGTLSFAALFFRRTPRLLTVTTPHSKKTVHWLRMIGGEARRAGDTLARTAFLPISSTLRRSLLGGGVPEPAVHVLRPGLDFGRVRHKDRDAVRAGWGIDDGNTRVIALLADPPGRVDALAAVRAIGLGTEAMRATPYRFVPLLHPAQQHRRRGERALVELAGHPRARRDERLQWPWQVLPGCDLALAMGEHAGGLSLLWAMAANVPIVAEATYACSEVVEDRHSALLTQPNVMRTVSHRLRQVTLDTQLAWQLKDTARHEAYSFFSTNRYRDNLRTVYQQLVGGEDIEVPPMESTGGLRFAGRA